MNSEMEDDFQFYVENQKNFSEMYLGRFVVIKNKEIVGNYKTLDEAIEEASKKYIIGTFLVREVGIGAESYTQTFHSRVNFNGFHAISGG